MEADKIEMGMPVQLRGTVESFVKNSPFISLHVQSTDIEPAYYDVPYYYLEPAPRKGEYRLTLDELCDLGFEASIAKGDMIRRKIVKQWLHEHGKEAGNEEDFQPSL